MHGEEIKSDVIRRHVIAGRVKAEQVEMKANAKEAADAEASAVKKLKVW